MFGPPAQRPSALRDYGNDVEPNKCQRSISGAYLSTPVFSAALRIRVRKCGTAITAVSSESYRFLGFRTTAKPSGLSLTGPKTAVRSSKATAESTGPLLQSKSPLQADNLSTGSTIFCFLNKRSCIELNNRIQNGKLVLGFD